MNGAGFVVTWVNQQGEGMSLVQIVFYIFCAIAFGGASIATAIWLNIRLPSVLPILHGLGGLVAIGLLAYVLAGMPSEASNLWWPFIILGAGFLGGVLFFRVLYPRKAPHFLIAGHGLVGLIGLFLLYRIAF